jgi:hypothetical protein
MKVVRMCLVAGVAVAAVVPASAQLQTFPELDGRIPAPLPSPPQPPIINGPYQQGPPPGVAETKPLTTFSDRVTHCQQQGAANGLHGRRLSAYVRRCGNSG